MTQSSKNAAAVIAMEEPPTLLFDIREAKDVVLPGVELYDCSYQSRGRTAKFRLEFHQLRGMSGNVIPLASAEGRFVAVTGSDNSSMLGDLMKVLEAKRIPAPEKRETELAFDAVVLGEKQSRSHEGAYADKPAGDWKTIKIFFPKGGDDGEMFLNINPVLGKAELSEKDSDYGDYLLAKLAKVL